MTRRGIPQHNNLHVQWWETSNYHMHRFSAIQYKFQCSVQTIYPNHTTSLGVPYGHVFI